MSGAPCCEGWGCYIPALLRVVLQRGGLLLRPDVEGRAAAQGTHITQELAGQRCQGLQQDAAVAGSNPACCQGWAGMPRAGLAP